MKILPTYFDMKQACEFCCLSRRTMDYAKDRGDVPFIRKGKKIIFRLDDLTRFMDQDRIDIGEVLK